MYLKYKYKVNNCTWSTISLKIHPRKVLQFFGAGRSTVEQILNRTVIIAKHLEHQHNLYHSLIYFRKAFGRVCHHGLWQILLGGTIYGGFVLAIRALTDRPSSELSWKKSTRRILPGIPSASDRGVYSLLFCSIFENHTWDLNEQHTAILIGDWLGYSLHFADDIDLMGAATTNCKTWHTHWFQVPAHTAWEST